MTNGEMIVSEFSKRMMAIKSKPLRYASLGELAQVIEQDTNHTGSEFKKEFSKRVKKISKTPLKDISLADLTIVVRTLEAMERTRYARTRTWLAAMTVILGVIGLGLLGFRMFFV